MISAKWSYHNNDYFSLGLPFSFRLEGPSTDSDVIFVFGGRPITDGFDLNFSGRVATAVFSADIAPPMFSRCVLECLESLTVDTTGTSLTLIPFNVSSRQLELLGPATPAQVQQVLRSAIYLNRALTLNINSFQIEVCHYFT